MTAIQWFAFVILPAAIAGVGYISVLRFERAHSLGLGTGMDADFRAYSAMKAAEAAVRKDDAGKDDLAPLPGRIRKS